MTATTTDLAAATAELRQRWDAAVERIDAEYAKLTPVQRRRHSRSLRINQLRNAYMLVHGPAVLRQIHIERLGYTVDDCRSGALGDLARAGIIHINSDRHRLPAVVKWAKGQGA